jgi:hypothetical protein
MKRTHFLVLSLLFASFATMAQTTESSSIEPLKAGLQPGNTPTNGWVLDSVLSFTGVGGLYSGQYYLYDNEGRVIEESYYTVYPSWRGSSRTQRSYDANDNVIEETTYEWDEEKNDWKPSSKYTTAYGAALGDQLYFVFYYWVNGAWLGQYKTERIYENGDVAGDIMYGWDTLSGDWVPASKTHYVYVGEQLETWTSNWEPTNKRWEVWNKSRTVSVSDGPEGFTTSQMEEWTSVNQFWAPRYRYSIKYDEFGNQAEVMQYQYDTTMTVPQWVIYRHSEATWAAFGKPLTSLDSMTNYMNVYGPFRKTVAEYDARLNPTLQEVYEWQDWMGGWVGQSKQVRAYDASDRVVNSESYTWMSATSTWQGSSKYVTSYALNGLPEEIIIYSWYQSEPVGWVVQNKSNYTYNAANKETLSETSEWGGESNPIWIPVFREYTSYDTAFNRIAGHAWSNYGEAWKEFRRDTAAYDAYNNLIYEHNYEWNDKTKAFKSKNSARYYYSRLNTQLKGVELDDQKANRLCWTEKGRLHLINRQGTDYVSIYALDGRLVVNKRLNQENASFELPQGMYFVILGPERVKVLVP